MNKEKLYDIATKQIFLNELDGKYPFDYETKTFTRLTTRMTDPVLTDTNKYEGSIIFGTEQVKADYSVGRKFLFKQPQPEELTERLFQEFSRAVLRPELSSHRISQIINAPGINEIKGDGARDALRFVLTVTSKFNEQDVPDDCQLIYMSTSLCGEFEDNKAFSIYNQFKDYDIIRIPDRYMNGVKVMIINKLSVFQGLDVHTGETEDGTFFDINSVTKVTHPEYIYIMR